VGRVGGAGAAYVQRRVEQLSIEKARDGCRMKRYFSRNSHGTSELIEQGRGAFAHGANSTARSGNGRQLRGAFAGEIIAPAIPPRSQERTRPAKLDATAVCPFPRSPYNPGEASIFWQFFNLERSAVDTTVRTQASQSMREKLAGRPHHKARHPLAPLSGKGVL